MSKISKFIIVSLSVLILSSCATYTVKTGLEKITLPQSTTVLETRYAVIEEMEAVERAKQEAALKAEEEKRAKEKQEKADREAEAAAKAEEERAKKEEKAKAQEEIIKNIEVLRSRNDFPLKLSELTYPHIFRPINSNELLSASFTKIDTLLLPLGKKVYTSEEITHIASSIKDIKAEFIFVTGNVESLIALANYLQRDAILLEGGLVIFTPVLESATKDSAIFTVADGKKLSLSLLNLSDEMIKSENLDIKAWQEYLNTKADEEIKKVEEVTATLEGDSKLFALSSSEPSSLDWSIFTPYSYRFDYSYPISDKLLESWSDTYRATHFSEETDSGITIKTPSISERIDFFYSQGLMEVSSETLSVGILSEGEVATYALLATYIVP